MLHWWKLRWYKENKVNKQKGSRIWKSSASNISKNISNEKGKTKNETKDERSIVDYIDRTKLIVYVHIQHKGGQRIPKINRLDQH